MADQTLQLEVSLENGQFKVASKQVEDGIKKTGDNAKKTTKSFSKLNMALKGFAIGAGLMIVKFFKDSVKAASDLQEVTSKFNTVFKGNMNVASAAVKDLTENYAMSTTEARSYLSSIQDLLVPMGMASDQAAVMSEEVVKLSADLGSFNNLPTAQVMADIESALVGNFETMKKYGVVLNDTVIRQKALEMGFKVGKGVIDANIKSQVAYKLMLEGSEAATGDMARTSDSYANSMKRLNAAFDDFSSRAGKSAMTTLSKLANLATTALKKMDDVLLQNEIHSRASIKLDKMKVKNRFDEMSTFDQIKWTHKTMNQLLEHEWYLHKQINDEKNKAKDKVKKKKPKTFIGKKVKKEADPEIVDFINKQEMLMQYHDVEMTLEDDAAMREQDRQNQAASNYESFLNNKLMLDTNYAKGMMTVMSTASVFLAEKNKKLFKFGQALAIGQTWINTFQGMTKAYAQLGVFGGIGAGVIFGAGILATRKIAAQKPPEYAVGSFNVPATGPAIVHKGEMITSQSTAEAIRSGDATLSSGGGGKDISVYVDGDQLFKINEGYRDDASMNMGGSGSIPVESAY